MKTVIGTRVVLVAALGCLAAPTALGAGPTAGPRYHSPRVAAHPDAASRVRSRTTAQTTPEAAEPETVAAPPPAEGSIPYEGDPGMWDEHGGYFDDYGACDAGYCGPCRHGFWYFSGDYLLVRPRFSQGVAAIEQTLTIDELGQEVTTTQSQQGVSYCFNYSSSFRIALGYRLIDCGGDIQFSYWRLTGDDQISVGPAAGEGQLGILGQLGNNPGSGEFLTAWTGVTANIYDLDLAKSLSFGGPQGGPCDCGFCPRWDLRFSAGIRIGDVSRFNNNAVTEFNGDVVSWGNIDARVSGAGPRLGVQGRRYFGPCGKFSVFAKGSQALLIGDYDMSRVSTTIDGETFEQINVLAQHDSFCRLIPVTDLELGASWQIAPYAFASIGWLWQAWWDLGQAENISGSNFGPLDSANILGFDGLFVRGELVF